MLPPSSGFKYVGSAVILVIWARYKESVYVIRGISPISLHGVNPKTTSLIITGMKTPKLIKLSNFLMMFS
jgi:pectin methylesterase-like acyl-CoA thioesterase